MPRARTPIQRRLRRRGRLLAASAFILTASAAHAQSVDYPQLETLFGEPVTTSVTGAPQRASEAPAALTIITREDIRRSPAKDLIGLVRAYAGVEAARWTAQQGEVGIRGGIQPYNARLLVLVNGQQVYLDHYGMTNWALVGIRLSDIQQIEIIRGPNSALFGFNAVSGVINIITINPFQTQEANLTAEAGTHGYEQVSANAAVKLGKRFGLRLSGGYGGLDELKGLGSSPVANAFQSRKPSRADGTVELSGQFGEKTEATLSTTRSWSRQTEIVNLPVSTPTNDKFSALGGKISHDTGWGVLSARIYRNDVDIQAPITVGADGKTVELKFDNSVTVMSADVLVRVSPSSKARVSVERRHNKLEMSPGYSGLTHSDINSISGMWESVPTERLTLTVAGRLDRLKLEQEGEIDQPSLFTAADFIRSIDTWSFNTAALFKINAGSTLRIAAARGVQAPSLFNLGARLIIPVPGPFPYVSSGNPRLEPSVISSGEVGYSRTLGDHGGRLEVNAFYNKTRDLIGTPDSATPPLLTPPRAPFILKAAQNVGSFEAYGLEASLSGRLGAHVAWSANYTWTKTSQNILGETGDTFQWPVALDRSTPEHKLKAQASYERGPWLFAAASRYTSRSQQLVHLNRQLTPWDIDDGVAVDAKLAYRLSAKVTLEAAGENLIGAGGVDQSPVVAERRLRAGVRVQL